MHIKLKNKMLDYINKAPKLLWSFVYGFGIKFIFSLIKTILSVFVVPIFSYDRLAMRLSLFYFFFANLRIEVCLSSPAKSRTRFSLCAVHVSTLIAKIIK